MNKHLYLIIVLFLLVLPNLNALILSSGITLRTESSNSSMTFSIPVKVDFPITILPGQIILKNISYTNGELAVNITSINYTAVNSRIDSSAFPYLISESNVNEKRIGHNLTGVLNATLTFDVQRPPSKINYRSHLGTFQREYQKNEFIYDSERKRVTLDIIGLETSNQSNRIIITYDPSEAGGAGGGSSEFGVGNVTESIKEALIEAPKEIEKGLRKIPKFSPQAAFLFSLVGLLFVTRSYRQKLKTFSFTMLFLGILIWIISFYTYIENYIIKIGSFIPKVEPVTGFFILYVLIYIIVLLIRRNLKWFKYLGRIFQPKPL